MYSVVLMMAMTAAPEASSFGGKWSHGSCYGSSCYGSCYGGGYNGSCFGYGYYGGSACFGSYAHGCYGGYGGCYGGGYGGCYGGGYGGGCAGSTYLNLGCHGNYYFTPYSCTGYGIYGGATYMWPTPYYGGGASCYGYGLPIPAYPVTPKVEEKIEPKKTSLPVPPDQARVIIRLPADAKLFANNQLMTLSSDERVFNTPTLEKGQDFQYSMKIEYTRDGKTITDNQVVKVRAGRLSIVEFPEKGETVATTIKLIAPEGAKVFVADNQELPVGAKEFQTPRLLKGQEYAYRFRAEVTKNGNKLDQTQRVVFKAGEPVTVDFTDMDVSRTASK